MGGIKYGEPGLVYVITQPVHLAHKIGISGQGAWSRRRKNHLREGWLLFRTLNRATVDDAIAVEQAVLRHLREVLLLPPYLTNEFMPYWGAGETVSADGISLISLWGLTLQQARSLAAKQLSSP
ncbi:hypothetical protein [Streptomyces flavofungini]|uniref:hypothetical protein n=1 Tax=Streptomyces flavofungini TaxID=68200 RepID=UPI0025AF1426|nr:hypothetical protein [Streptomyces flavofungini]WJV51726.1 hypothetical protein QUY26_39550 [Streptomyces flavofungini]